MEQIKKSYTLIRSRRKTLSLHIDEKSCIVVRAPFHIGQKYIEKFINEKENWIKKQKAQRGKINKNKERFAKLMDEVAIQNIKNRAKSQLKERLDFLSDKFDYPYKKMRLSNAKSRWGSCSHDNTISLNWKVMLAPPQVIDYLIVHELMHTKHKNHKILFWDSVAKAHPTYKEDRKWLRDNSHLLSIDA